MSDDNGTTLSAGAGTSLRLWLLHDWIAGFLGGLGAGSLIVLLTLGADRPGYVYVLVLAVSAAAGAMLLVTDRRRHPDAGVRPLTIVAWIVVAMAVFTYVAIIVAISNFT